MKKLRNRGRFLLGYLLIAYVFVQSISGFLHVHVHDPLSETETAHHHYPSTVAFSGEHDLLGTSEDPTELEITLDGVFGSKVFPTLLVAMLLVLVLPIIVSTRSSYFRLTSTIPITSQAFLRTPPLRAPPTTRS